METKLKHSAASLFFCLVLSAMAPLYPTGAALPEAAKDIRVIVEPPGFLRAVAASHNSTRLVWSAVPGGASGYEIERKQPGGSFGKVGETTSDCFFTDENLLADAVYVYRVRAVAGGVPSPYSNHSSIHLGNPVSYIPAAVRVDPDGKILREPLENNLGPWGSFDGDDVFPIFQPGDCLDGDFYVGIQLSHDLGDFNTASGWDASLEIVMEYDGDSLWSKPLLLDNGEQTFLATVFHDKAVSCDPGYRFTVTEKTANGTVPANNVSLKVLLFEKEEGGFSATEPIALSHHYNNVKSQVTWSHSRRGTASYDLEWVFIAAHENFTGTTADSAFGFKEPVRINTPYPSHSHHVFYPKGKVWYRVRALGYDPGFPGHRIVGNWNYGPDPGMAVENANAGLNWQLQTTFAEGGKYRNLVQYMDGSLRQRQAVTNLNTGETVMVGETKYDFEGRDAVEILPAPVGGNSLAFRPGINVFTASDPEIAANTSSKREKFHYDNGDLPNSPLSTASGTGRYYSPANDMSMIHRDYLPDAEGFAYSQKTYTRDGTGRIAVQSGVGKKFRTDGSHSTRFYYGEASPEELIRLFGPNVGKASHYRKNMTADPNGQASIAYLDQEGRTVATALAGESPTGIVDPLESYRTNEEAMTGDGLAANAGEPLQTENNLKDIRKEALSAENGRLHEEFLLEEKILLEERYGGEPVLSSAEKSQIGPMANMLPTAKEYKALMDLYQSTNGSGWNYKNGWLNADPLVIQGVAGWTGVTVNGNGNITALYLPNNNLAGPLPPSFVDLEHLVAVNLFNNNLNGAIPDSIGQLDQLVELRLNNNRMTGSIPAGIGGLVNLTVLTLHNNLLGGDLPSGMGNLVSLTEINLYNNAFTGPIPSSFGKLSNLKLLSASFNRLSGSLPDSLGYMQSLVALRLERNLLEGPLPSSIGNLVNLTEMLLYNNRIGGSLPESLGNLTGLLKIELHNNLLAGPIPESIGNLENLTEIHLFNNLLSGRIPASLGKLKKLKRLLLNGNNMEGTLPAELGGLSELAQFNIYNNDISGTLPASFGNLKKLTLLSLSHNSLSGPLPHSMGNMAALNTLRLEFNQLEGPLPSGLTQLSGLSVVDITSNKFRGPIPDGMGSLSLTDLAMRDNYFTMEDLLKVNHLLANSSKYSTQKAVDVSKAHNTREGGQLTLTAGVDLESAPVSEYQWFRNSQSINQRSAAGHTVSIENVSGNDAGNYSYRIWNSALPALTLTSEIQNVHVDAPGWKSITVDLMSHNRTEGNSSALSKTLLNTVPNTPYSLSYELSGLDTQLEGIGCRSCSFELEIYLLDPEGKPVNLGDITGNTSPDSYSFRNSYTVEDCMVVQTEATVNTGGIVLDEIGEYTVVKELRLLSPAATQARAEIIASPGFAGQLAALDTLYNSYGDCEFCIPEDGCPEAEEAIAQAVAETAALDCENIRETIISEILQEQESYTEQDIMVHPLYCQYENCIRDMDASVFETTTARLKGWYVAGQWAYHVLEDRDPFYMQSGTGAISKPALIHALNNITIGNYTGTVHEVTNPDNTAMYYNAAGQPDPVNGKHLLYTNLLDQRAEMGEIWYREKLDGQRWMLFRNFYFEASRKIKLGIPSYRDCDASKDVLEKMEELPTTEEGMQAWAITNNIVDPVDSIQVETVLYMLTEGCGGDFTLSESNSLYAHLEAYLNSNRMTNPYNFLLAEDISSDPSLGAIEDILSGRDCSLAESGLAVSNPMVCLRDTVVYVGNHHPMMTSQEKQNEIALLDKDQKITDLPELSFENDEWFETWESIYADTADENGGVGAKMMMPGSVYSEYMALMKLYEDTDGANSWHNKTGWEDADPNMVQSPQGWAGIVLNASGNVISLNLIGNNLQGSIPNDISNLSYLEGLNLSDNNINGNIPNSLISLTNLRYLNLRNNNLENGIPSNIGYLSNLEYLYLGDNPLGLTIPSTLGNLDNLLGLDLENNQLTGNIPISPSISNLQVFFRKNGFTFSNLLPIKSFIQSSSPRYSPQDSVDVAKNINIPTGETLVLTTDIDRNTAPASQYQWFKDGVAVNQRSTSGHTLTISNASASHSGGYYYKIWNPDLPALTLASRVQEVLVYSGQPVRICLEYGMGDAQGGYGQPGTNPSMELFSLQTTWAAIVDSCLADNEARAGALKELAEEKLMESWLREYYEKFDLSCLDNINESFTYTYTPKEYHYTLYYYDQAGSLIQTVPPKGVQPMGNSQVELVKSGSVLHPAHTLATRYRYNSRGQLVWQESPDAGESKFWYNRAGQLRLSQDARQATKNAYSYTRYDRQGRVTETGEMLSSEHIDSLKAKLDHSAFPDPAQYSRHDVTLTGYDRPLAGADPTFAQENLRSRVSWTAMAERDAADTVFTLYSYDPHGNVKALLQDLPGLGTKKTEYRYDLVSGNVNLVLYQYGEKDQLIHRYSYDADNRIEEVHTSTDGYVWNREAAYTYYPSGPLARIELGEYNVQGMDYYYTLQGWLKGVNMPMVGDPGGDGVGGFRTGTDAFAFALGYYEGDYKPINPNTTVSDSRDKLWDRYRETRDTVSAAGLYNGNISWMSTDLPGLGSNRMQAMVYGYDQLHRIVQARSLTGYGTAGFDERVDAAMPYDVDYSYDANGNLLTLQRLDHQTDIQDDLTYEYYDLSNKLKNVDGSVDENYTYDEIGNLISDNAEGIESIAWTPYGKVRAVTKDDNSEVRFRYDASDNRIAKIAGSDTTVYVRDASGNVMGVYKNDTLIEQSIYGSSRLGLMTASSKTGYRTLGGKKYELSNHLGNVLAVVTDNINFDQDSTWASVVNMTDYYPFGLAMEGRSLQDSAYRYGFNGKEEDPEGMGGGGSTYDYWFRIYNPSIAKFLSVDPLAADYPWYTPFQYAGNSPIANIDVDGLEDQLAIDGTIVSGPINMERYNNAILQKRVESERQVMGLKPFSRRDDPNQSFIGPNNNPLSFEESHRMNRKYEAESNFNRLSSDISATSPFVGGGSENNPFGFASTFVTASKEVPSIFLQEYIGVQLLKTFTKPVKTFSEYRSATIGVFRNTDGVHHSTLRSQGYQLYRSNTLQFNNNLERATQLTGDFLDVKGVLDKIGVGIEERMYRTTLPGIPENEIKKENE